MAISGSAPPYDSLAAVFLVAYGFLAGTVVLAVRHLIGLVGLLRRLQGPDL